MPVQAAVITYEEALVDTKDPLVFLDFRRDLERKRTLGDGTPPIIESDDAMIEAANAISESFGRWGRDPITYSHIFQPVGPVFQFELASLRILAASVSGTPTDGPPPDFFEFLFGLGTPDDPVDAEGNFLGYLNPANPFQQVEWEFSTGNSAMIGVLLADNRLDVTITPMGPGFIGEPPPDPDKPDELAGDKISVSSSTLSVTYTVPEPSAVVLFLVGSAALLARKRSDARHG